VDGVLLFNHPMPVPYARALGEWIARIHLAGRDFRHRPVRTIDRAGLIRRSVDDLVWLCGERNDDVEFYRRASPAVADALDGLDPKLLPYGPCHGDVHAHNAFVDDAGRLTVMDFESCGEDFWAAELTSFVWAARKNRLLTAAIDAFVDGYDSVRPRTPEERRAEPLFMASKELRYLGAFAGRVNAIGHQTFRFPGLDWFAQSVRANVAAAGLF
jgi:Ser/Thr protein kinase RdoA (MazF antagonist)